jgi:hypothetical protein
MARIFSKLSLKNPFKFLGNLPQYPLFLTKVDEFTQNAVIKRLHFGCGGIRQHF